LKIEASALCITIFIIFIFPAITITITISYLLPDPCQGVAGKARKPRNSRSRPMDDRQGASFCVLRSPANPQGAIEKANFYIIPLDDNNHEHKHTFSLWNKLIIGSKPAPQHQIATDLSVL
jgi:hypothetical protein